MSDSSKGDSTSRKFASQIPSAVDVVVIGANYIGFRLSSTGTQSPPINHDAASAASAPESH